MAMNREQRRYLQKQGQIDKEGNVVGRRIDRNQAKPEERAGVREYLKGVRSELNRVTWPTRPEVINYTIVVLITLAIITALVTGLDIVFARGVDELLNLR